jgi:hypothetical protein
MSHFFSILVRASREKYPRSAVVQGGQLDNADEFASNQRFREKNSTRDTRDSVAMEIRSHDTGIVFPILESC